MTEIQTPADLAALMGWDFAPSPEQWEAIRAPLEPAVVIAGAGSGKTTLMAARVVYGLAREGELSAIFARVHRHTGTPLVATASIAALVVPLALFVPLTPLAEATSLVTLAVFALVNLALLRLRYRGVRSDNPHVSVPIWIPAIGLVTCLAMMAGALFR